MIVNEKSTLVCIGVGLGLLASTLLAQRTGGAPQQPDHAKTIRAEHFEVVDQLGQKRAEMTAGAIFLYNAKGQSAFTVVAGDDGSDTIALGQKSQQLLLLRYGPDGTAAIGIGSTAGRPSVSISISKDGVPSLTIRSKSGNAPFIDAHISNGGVPGIQLNDGKNPRIVLSLESPPVAGDGGEGHLLLHVDAEGTPGVYLKDKQGRSKSLSLP